MVPVPRKLKTSLMTSKGDVNQTYDIVCSHTRYDRHGNSHNPRTEISAPRQFRPVRDKHVFQLLRDAAKLLPFIERRRPLIGGITARNPFKSPRTFYSGGSLNPFPLNILYKPRNRLVPAPRQLLLKWTRRVFVEQLECVESRSLQMPARLGDILSFVFSAVNLKPRPHQMVKRGRDLKMQLAWDALQL